MVRAAASATDRESVPKTLVGSGLPTGLPNDASPTTEDESHKEHVLTDGRKMSATRYGAVGLARCCPPKP